MNHFATKGPRGQIYGAGEVYSWGERAESKTARTWAPDQSPGPGRADFALLLLLVHVAVLALSVWVWRAKARKFEQLLEEAADSASRPSP